MLAKVKRQKTPYTILCIYMPAANQTDGPGSNDEYIHWHKTVLAAAKSGTNSTCELFSEHPNQLTVLVGSSSYTAAGQVSRLIRNRLLKDFPSARPNLAAVHVDSDRADAELMFTRLCDNLKRNVTSKSTRVEIKRYKS